ncbi:hypothetical protein R2R35_09400 [Anaerocolumna sp. AGMB13020]|uniref:hypothetical protein n=1 Tax=Anaerocolumna sp. AGMB13020 TaxID=3081750 RepID=UPI0029530B81|nr:hypothetical protein [Anaerocolumna sp. AGMB13020]WOO38696.1 hypothetical protein R2R35_09400 [Anaerocolumna sp. AGMB13020]
MNFSIEDLLISLNIMWKGMFSIFVVIIIITLLVMLFQWFERNFLDKKKDKQ